MDKMIRYSRFIKLLRNDLEEHKYHLPAVATLPSGFSREVNCIAAPLWPGIELSLISRRLLDEAGGSERNNACEWDERSWGPCGLQLVRIALEISRKNDVLRTSFLACVTDLPHDVDMLVMDAVLNSFGDYYYNELYCELLSPKIGLWSYTSLDQLLSSAVLILGNDSESHMARLREIEVTINALRPLRAWLLKDYSDYFRLDLGQKLLVMAATSAWVIVEDTAPSGHLLELGLLSQISTPLAVLREKECASSWMADPIIRNSDNRRLFEYEYTGKPLSLFKAVHAAWAWASRFLQQKSSKLYKRYPWRPAEAKLWEDLDG